MSIQQNFDVKKTSTGPGSDRDRSQDVAIVGIGCLFPGSPGLKAYLQLLLQGRDAISDPPDSHAHLNQYLDPDPRKADHIYCNRGGFLPPVSFDPTAFGIPPNVIEATDTSQLLSLLVATNALEDAGYGPDGKPFHRKRTSVILGVTGTQELVIPLSSRLGHPIWKKALAESGITGAKADEVVEKIASAYVQWQENSFPGLLGNVVAGRICNRLDLGGTNCVVDAACASSMGAIHLALLELCAGRSDMVITGGADTINDIFMHMCFSRTMILSKSGHARPFSAQADGTVLGEGIGLLVLKRLEDAIQDNDRVYAVIKGLGSASDGRSNGIYAPRVEGQIEALERAYAQAGIDPASVEMVEAHGTGTRVGDEVEFEALCRVFGRDSANRRCKCALGSVKSNIGHTKAAAGTAGLIKAALALHHKVVFPTLKADQVDPKLKVEQSPFYINNKLRPWIGADGHPRRAGVSAFGFGGSNFHAVLEEFDPSKKEVSWDGRVQILAFSHDDFSALLAEVEKFRDKVLEPTSEKQDIELAAASLRAAFNPGHDHRLVLVADFQEPVTKLADDLSLPLRQLQNGSGLRKGYFYGRGKFQGKLAFLFPGQGSQYPYMGRDLACVFPEFLDILREADRLFHDRRSLSSYIYPEEDQGQNAARQLRSTRIAQPAIGAVSAGMAAVLERFGLKPDLVCGHSFGELTALFAAGWITRADFLRLSVLRGQLMHQAASGQTNPGGMLAVKAEAEACRQIVESLAGHLVVANFNSPVQTVLSGSLEAIDKAYQFFRQKGISAVKLPVSAAFHSPLVTEAARPFAEAVAGTEIEPTPVKVMSNTTAVPYPLEKEQAQELLGHQLSHPVRFLDSIVSLYRQHEARIFVEVGPRKVLTGLVNEILEDSKVITAAIDDSAGRGWQLFDLAYTLAMAASLGLPVDLGHWESPPRPRPKARLEIKLCGANYRSKQTAPSAGAREKSAKVETNSQKMISANKSIKKNHEHKQEHKVMNNKHLPEPAFEETRPASRQQPVAQRPQIDPAGGSSLMLQGIQALQNLHQQTALAHQKFLETQAEAARTLQRILEADTRRVSAPAVEVQEPEAVAKLSPRPVPDSKPPSYKVSSRPEPEAGKANPVEDEPPAATETASLPPATTGKVDLPSEPASSGAEGENIARVLVETVSRLTGYPEQMLEMDMDIEADLGIDSIKRVEILSAMEETMPDLPKITPDQMGKLKTLGQIRDFLVQDSSGKEIAPSEKPAFPGSGSKEETSGVAADDIARVLVETVSRLTGYPEQMLEMDMDIEADLGIDSIKRVEILSAMEETMPDLPRITPDQMGKLKTLGQIRDFLASGQPQAACKTEEQAPCIPADNCCQQSQDFLTELPRKIVRPVPWPEKGSSKVSFRKDAPVIICGRDSSRVKSLETALAGKKIAVAVFPPETASYQDIDRAAGLILVAPLEPPEAFALARHCAPLLQASADKGGAFFATVTFIDGAFGLSGGEINQAEQGALAGLLKTAAREWTCVRCLALDLDPSWQTDSMAEAVVEQLLCCPGPSGVEIGLGPGSRTRLEMVPDDFPEGLPDLGPEDVVVITGGGRGVTARAAAVLAAACRPKIVLLGRSPEPFDEPGWLQGITGQADMKKALLEFGFKDGKPSPRQLETAYRRYLANREIRASLKAVADAGSQVRYFQADVRNQEEVGRVIDEVQRTMGRVTALIHGAGVLADKAIAEKSDQQFELVYSTKVDGWHCLLKACAGAPLRYVVVFSSVTARTGNPGQADYAMANEALNKLAAAWARQHPACKVTAINWGPWDGGMVDQHLKRNFQRQGVELIPLEEGARAMVAEMAGPSEGPVEVVIGSVLELPQEQQTEKQEHEPGAEVEMDLDLAFQHEVSLDTHPVLDDHRLDGRPVVPMALLTEWLGHGALHANPGLRLVGLDRVRLLKGIVLEEKFRKVSLLTGKAKPSVSGYTVPVEIRDGFEGGRPVTHCRAEAILAESIPEPPVFDQKDLLNPGAKTLEVKQAYDRMLFHGASFQGIEAIVRIDAKGLAARLATAPPPRKWLKEPLRSNWIADPLVLDCAFQMAIIWSRTICGKPSLPSYIQSYRQYVERFPASGVTAVMEVSASSANKVASDFTFIDSENRVIARLEGYEAVMDENLERAFNAN